MRNVAMDHVSAWDRVHSLFRPTPIHSEFELRAMHLGEATHAENLQHVDSEHGPGGLREFLLQEMPNAHVMK